MRLIDQFLGAFEILHLFPPGPYVTVSRPLYKIMALPVASLRVNDPVDFSVVQLIENHQLRFRWWLAVGTRCIAVKQRDIEDVVLPDHMWNDPFITILIDELTYHIWSCSFVIRCLRWSCCSDVLR